jgi:O-antigen/teichoic acid export membrane protein
VEGAIIGIVLATAVEVVVARWFVRPGLRGGGEHVTVLWSYALPLFLAAVSMRAFDKLDLFTLKALGASAAVAGQYGAAQNLTIGPGLVALSVSGLLLSTLTRTLRTGSPEDAARLGRNALRGALLLLPFAAIVAGSATPISTLVFGDAFAPAGPLLSVLIFGALGLLVISISSAMLIAIGRSTWTAAIALPLPFLALAAQLAVIPRFGAVGAAAVTTAVATIGVLSAIVAVERAWRLLPPAASVVRAILVTVAAYAASAWWTSAGVSLLLEMLTLSLLVPLAYWATGELAPDERVELAALVRRGGAAGVETP